MPVMNFVTNLTNLCKKHLNSGCPFFFVPMISRPSHRPSSRLRSVPSPLALRFGIINYHLSLENPSGFLWREPDFFRFGFPYVHAPFFSITQYHRMRNISRQNRGVIRKVAIIPPRSNHDVGVSLTAWRQLFAGTHR